MRDEAQSLNRRRGSKGKKDSTNNDNARIIEYAFAGEAGGREGFKAFEGMQCKVFLWGVLVWFEGGLNVAR